MYTRGLRTLITSLHIGRLQIVRVVVCRSRRMMLTANLSVQDRMANGTVTVNEFAKHAAIDSCCVFCSIRHSQVHKAGYFSPLTVSVICVAPTLPCGWRHPLTGQGSSHSYPLPTGGSQIENQRTRKCCWQAIQSYKPVSFASPR